MPRLKSYPIEAVDGVESQHAARLIAEGVQTTGQLLKRAAHPRSRALLAARTGIPEALLLRWAHRADLMRVPGVGKLFSELLEAAGAGTLQDLGRYDAAVLTRTLSRVNESKGLARRTPTFSMVAAWVEDAEDLPPVVR